MSALELAAPHRGGRKRWTEERILAATQRHVEATGKQPSAEDWRAAGVGRPNTSTVLYVFGSWSKMIAAAGFTPLPAGRPPTWSRELCVQAIQRWMEEQGRPPTTREWRNPSGWHPQATTVWRIFGSWEKGLTAAGVSRMKRRRNANPLWSEDDIAAAMLDELVATGKWPTCHSWARGARGRPCASTVKWRFGSWNAAKRYAGWDPDAASRVVRRERVCAGCDGDYATYTTGCSTCSDRKRTRARRAPKPSGPGLTAGSIEARGTLLPAASRGHNFGGVQTETRAEAQEAA